MNLTKEEKEQAQKAVTNAVEQLWHVLDLHGQHSDYRDISAVYPLIEQLQVLQWRYSPSSYA